MENRKFGVPSRGTGTALWLVDGREEMGRHHRPRGVKATRVDKTPSPRKTLRKLLFQNKYS